MKDETKIANLGPVQLRRLREDIVLNSLFVDDYKNRYGIDARAVCDFFDGYTSYLYEIAEEEGFFKAHDDDDCPALFDAYDTRDNLRAWQDMYACGLGC